MRLFDKRTPLQKEWEKLEVQEQRFLQKRSEKRESILNQKLEEKIPPKLQKTLDTAFAKAFALIFEKGTGVIEKTYQRTKLEQDYQVRQYMADVKQNSKSLRSFSKKARDTGTKNLLLSGVSGIGMGVLGIGLPDIPVFTGMILKNIYETALQYGYSYESREEKYFILLLIRGAVSYGDTLCEIDGKVNEFIRNASLCSTVLQNFWKAHCFINSLRLGSTFSPPFSLESWWCFPLFAGQYCLLKKTPKIFGFFSKNFLSSKIRLSEKPGQTYRYCKRYSDD